MSQWDLFWRNANTILDKAFLAPPYLWFLGLIPIMLLLYLLKLRLTQRLLKRDGQFVRQRVESRRTVQRQRRHRVLARHDKRRRRCLRHRKSLAA